MRTELPVGLFEQSTQVLAPVTHMDNLNAVACGPIDNEVASPRHNEAAMASAELRAGYPHPRMIHKPGAMLLQPVNEALRCLSSSNTSPAGTT